VKKEKQKEQKKEGIAEEVEGDPHDL